jgi:hypothetical protein
MSARRSGAIYSLPHLTERLDTPSVGRCSEPSRLGSTARPLLLPPPGGGAPPQRRFLPRQQRVISCNHQRRRSKDRLHLCGERFSTLKRRGAWGASERFSTLKRRGAWGARQGRMKRASE